MSAVKSWLDWLTSVERRGAGRQQMLPLIAHYWDGGVPIAHRVRDISSQGMYLLTRQRWYPGTLVMLSLQRQDLAASDPHRAIAVKGKVVRSGQDGVGFSFVMNKDPRRDHNELPGGADRKAFESFLRGFKENQGQALVEYILMLPLLFLLIVNVVNFGAFFYAWITVANAARAGADYAVLSGASVGFPAQANAASVAAVVTQDLASLPNSASATIKSCTNYLGNAKILGATTVCNISPAPPADPESQTYSLLTVDVTYTYQPLIPAGFQFPNLRIYATIPPTTIRQQAFMRVLQ